MGVPQNMKIELPNDPASPFLSIYPKEIKLLSRRDICTSMFIAALFTIVKVWKQRKYTHTHTHRGILFNHEKEGIPAICNNIDESWGHYAKWNKWTEKDKYCMISLMGGILKIQTHRNSRFVIASSWGGVGARETLFKGYKLSVIWYLVCIKLTSTCSKCIAHFVLLTALWG